ncbi:MAG: hypothetical protein SVE93_03275 [Candidatus Thermoplasmatota archaeon]|nr:hypothetical protein [Candidatus Thermoplasmatota archaeon]
MRSLLTAVMAALLLGLVVGMPVRARALEEEGAITQPREINPVTNAITAALVLGPLAGALSFAVGFAMIIVGFAFALTIIGAPLGIFIIFLGLIFMFILPILCVVIGSPIGFMLGLGEGIALIPQEIGDFIIRLVDACVPG